jgi:hypothetical protein
VLVVGISGIEIFIEKIIIDTVHPRADGVPCPFELKATLKFIKKDILQA